MSNTEVAGDLVGTLLDIYRTKLDEMKAGGELNASLLREVREFLKQHDITLDATAAPMQDLTNDVDELAELRAHQSGQAGRASG